MGGLLSTHLLTHKTPPQLAPTPRLDDRPPGSGGFQGGARVQGGFSACLSRPLCPSICPSTESWEFTGGSEVKVTEPCPPCHAAWGSKRLELCWERVPGASASTDAQTMSELPPASPPSPPLLRANAASSPRAGTCPRTDPAEGWVWGQELEDQFLCFPPTACQNLGRAGQDSTQR